MPYQLFIMGSQIQIYLSINRQILFFLTEVEIGRKDIKGERIKSKMNQKQYIDIHSFIFLLFTIMQQTATWYFLFGSSSKTSLAAEFSRQNSFLFLQSPSLHDASSHFNTNTIIEGSEDLFYSLESIKSSLNVIQIGQSFETEGQRKIVREYCEIGRCIWVRKEELKEFRKKMYPNLVFVYGPLNKQIECVSQSLAMNMGYLKGNLPKDSNEFVNDFDKTKNYVIEGLFKSKEEIKIIQEYFSIKIVHFSYERSDLPNHDEYFDQQYDLLPFLSQKEYFISVKGNHNSEEIMKNIGNSLCPKLIYINSKEQEIKYAEDYVGQTNGLLLQIQKINEVNKRKGIKSSEDQLSILTQIFYKDFGRKQILMSHFPFDTSEFEQLQKRNREFSCFVDLNKNHQYTSSYISSIYFLEKQKRISPNFDNSLSEQLADKKQYWLINGPGTSGKTTVAKYLSSQFHLQLIQFESYIASIKEKLLSPEDGQEVPLKKYLAHFSSLIKNSSKTYIIDGLPFSGNDLSEWVKAVGIPTVMNLRVEENEQIKRGRKKAEGDINAEISEEEVAKAKENSEKNNQWIQKISELSPSSKIYQVEYNMPQLLAQPLLNSVLKPRIFLVKKNNNLIYQNIAIKFNMGFVNLEKNSLRCSQKYVRECGKRDIILAYYNREDDHLISEDMYWIEKHLGDIRYLGICEHEQKQIKEQPLILQKPVEEQKPKAMEEGEQEGEKEEEVEEGQKKVKKFDKYEYEWTKPVIHKNLSQWFLKLKKKVFECKSEGEQCYNRFGEVLDRINNEKLSVYEVVNC